MASSTPVATKLAALVALLNSGGSYKVSLHTSAYTPADAYSTASECAGTGYTAGGKALAGVTTTTSGTTAFADATDVAWTTATITGARYGIVYDTGNSNRVVGAYDFGSDKSVVAGTLTITWPAGDSANAMLRIG